jgi:hypothetical protein
MMKIAAAAFVVLSCLACIGCPIGPYTRGYKPISEWEKTAFTKANRQIYPNDVRGDFAAFDSARVAWPGIVLKAEPKNRDSVIEIHFVIQHHYYDWLEDFSIQQERIFLSPRGEGVFETTWWVQPTADTSVITQSVGNMVIVYGIPASIRDSIIVLNAYYIREIERKWFATDIFDYGRPGDSMRILRVPE